MQNREFLTHREACDLVLDREAIRQAIISGKLAAYVELKNCSCTVRPTAGKFPADDSNAFAEWFDLAWPGARSETDKREYILQGWFQVAPECATATARSAPEDAGKLWRVIAVGSDGLNVTFSPGDDVTLADLWFRSADVESLMPGHRTQPLSEKFVSRERNTMLRIIRALDVMAKLPDRGATAAVEKQLQELGFTGPKDATIRSVLADARALERDA